VFVRPSHATQKADSYHFIVAETIPFENAVQVLHPPGTISDQLAPGLPTAALEEIGQALCVLPLGLMKKKVQTWPDHLSIPKTEQPGTLSVYSA
jgi:hypothetical protein